MKPSPQELRQLSYHPSQKNIKPIFFFQIPIFVTKVLCFMVSVMDKSTAAGFTPEYAASKILDTVVYKKNELVISQFTPNLAVFLRHASPSLYFWVMAKRANKTTLPE